MGRGKYSSFMNNQIRMKNISVPAVLMLFWGVLTLQAKVVVLRGGEHKAKAIKVYKCPEVTKPVAVRYAWSRWSPSTLFNCSEIPVTPFDSTIR